MGSGLIFSFERSGGKISPDPLFRLRHVFDRHLDLQRQLLLLGGVDDGDRAERRHGMVVRKFFVQLRFDLLERHLGGRARRTLAGAR